MQERKRKKKAVRPLHKKGRKPPVPRQETRRIDPIPKPAPEPADSSWEALWAQPFQMWNSGDCLRVWIGNRVVQLPGRKQGQTFIVRTERFRHWGIGSGPRMSKEERRNVIRLIRMKNKGNPFLRIRF